eukprot:gene18036-21530_t
MTQGHNPLPPLSTSNNSFFDNNVLATPIDVSSTAYPPVSTLPPSQSAVNSGNNFFSECSPLGMPSHLPQVSQQQQIQQLQQQINNNPIAQSGDFFSPFISSMQTPTNTFTSSPVTGNINMSIPINNSNNNSQHTNNSINTSGNNMSGNNMSSNNMSSNNMSSNMSNLSYSTTSSSSSSVLPPLLNSSGMIPPPSSSSLCTNFFDQSPLSNSSSFSDFGPPAPSIGSYNMSNLTTSTTPPPTITNNNPLPPLHTYVQPSSQLPHVVQQSNNNNSITTSSGNSAANKTSPSQDGMDEFDLFLSLRNQKK